MENERYSSCHLAQIRQLRRKFLLHAQNYWTPCVGVTDDGHGKYEPVSYLPTLTNWAIKEHIISVMSILIGLLAWKLPMMDMERNCETVPYLPALTN